MKKIVFYGCFIFVMATVVEGGSYIMLSFLKLKGAVYQSVKPARSEYEKYLEHRHLLLGWPDPNTFGSKDAIWDRLGANKSPTYEKYAKYADFISVYGDSFVQGAEVGPDDSFTAVLCRMLDKKVSNYGVGGYGTDQAYLRFAINDKDRAPYVILGYSPENILRNVNRYRNYLYPVSGPMSLGFKPRYVIDSRGELKLIGLPIFDYEKLSRILAASERMDMEYFSPGGPFGVIEFKFPFSISFLKAVFGNTHIHAYFNGCPRYKYFYELSHDSRALLITFSIIKEFHKKALADGKHPIVLIIPNGLDFLFYEKTGQWTYSPLVVLLEGEGFEIIDAGPLMMKQIGKQGFRDLFRSLSGHYNKKGYYLLANVVGDYFIEKSYAGRVSDIEKKLTPIASVESSLARHET